VDIGTKNDKAAVVSVSWDRGRLRLVTHRIWSPTREQPLDIERTVEAFILERHSYGRVAGVCCDPTRCTGRSRR